MYRYELHHFCYQIAPRTLEKILELFAILECPLEYREGDARWAMVRQKGKNINIQLVETKKKPLTTESKISTHIAFLSKDPISDVNLIEEWAKNNRIKFLAGGWNERERWFDLPDIFVDFVVEIMDVKVVE